MAEKFSSIVTRFAEFLRVIDCTAVNALNIATSALSIGVWECVLSEDDVAESEADNAVNSNRASGGCVSCCKESSGKDSVMGGGNAPQSKGGDR